MTADFCKFPKGYNANQDLWESEGEWIKYMTVLYTGGKMK